MKKVLFVFLILSLAVAMFAAPVSAITYTDGQIIYSQDFNSVSKLEDLGYDANARARVTETTASANISMAIENKALKVTAKKGLFFIEILEAAKLKNVEKFTIQYDLKIDSASDDANSAAGMLLYWDVAKGKDSGNLYACMQFRNAYKTFLNNGRAVTTGTSTNWIDAYKLTNLSEIGITNAGLGTTHTIKMEVNGSKITSYVDGKSAGTFENAVVCESPLALLMYSNVDTTDLVAVYDNIKVWAGNGAEPGGSSNTTAPTTTKAPSTTSPSTSDFVLPTIALLGLVAGTLIISRKKVGRSR